MNKFRYVMAVVVLVIAGISVSAQETRSTTGGGGGGVIIGDFDIIDAAAVPQDQQGADDFAAEDEPAECCKTTFDRVKPHVN